MTEQQKKPANPCLNHRSWTNVKVRLGVLFIAVLCGVMLGGCDFFDTLADLLRINGADVEAQDKEDRIETLTISIDTFSIDVDNDDDPTPTHTVQQGGIIEFTMQSDGTVRFDSASDSRNREDLLMNDSVLLQATGSTAVMTIIRATVMSATQ